MEEFLSKITEILKSNVSNKEKKELLEQYHDSDIADCFEKLDDNDKLALAKILGKQRFSDVLAYIEDSDKFLDLLEDEQVADVIELMDADDAVDVLEDLDKQDREKILDLMETDAKKDVKLILSFDKEQVGSLMTTNFVTIKRGMSVKEAMRKLIAEAKENDNISTIMVLDDKDKFYGAMDLKDLICAREGDDLDDKIKTNYPYVLGKALIDDVINSLRDYNEDLIPVLDDNDELIGVITSTDIVELVQSEAQEDYNRLAGLTKQEDDQETLVSSIKKRIPWLILLLILGLVVSTVISRFESVIAAVTTAVFFQSVVFDMSGNGGTQSLAVTLTKITQMDEIDGKTFWKMFFKELRIGVVNGLILGSLSFGIVLLFLTITPQTQLVENSWVTEYWQQNLVVAGSVGISLFIALSLSSVMGLILPIFFKKIKVDPAVASGPMITTINDICSACIYYLLVGLFFQIL